MCTSKFCIISLFSYNYHITYLNEDAYYFEKKNDILNDVFNFFFWGGGTAEGVFDSYCQKRNNQKRDFEVFFLFKKHIAMYMAVHVNLRHHRLTES